MDSATSLKIKPNSNNTETLKIGLLGWCIDNLGLHFLFLNRLNNNFFFKLFQINITILAAMQM